MLADGSSSDRLCVLALCPYKNKNIERIHYMNWNYIICTKTFLWFLWLKETEALSKAGQTSAKIRQLFRLLNVPTHYIILRIKNELLYIWMEVCHIFQYLSSMNLIKSCSYKDKITWRYHWNFIHYYLFY